MTERLQRAYARHDAALRELVAAIEENDGGDENAYTVRDYVTVVGHARFVDGTRAVEGPTSFIEPFGGQPSYVTRGLLGKAYDLSVLIEEVGVTDES